MAVVSTKSTIKWWCCSKFHVSTQVISTCLTEITHSTRVTWFNCHAITYRKNASSVKEVSLKLTTKITETTKKNNERLDSTRTNFQFSHTISHSTNNSTGFMAKDHWGSDNKITDSPFSEIMHVRATNAN